MAGHRAGVTCSGNWSGGVFSWVIEEFLQVGCTALWGLGAEQPLFPEPISSCTWLFGAFEMPNIFLRPYIHLHLIFAL